MVVYPGLWTSESRMPEVSQVSVSSLMWRLVSKVARRISGVSLGRLWQLARMHLSTCSGAGSVLLSSAGSLIGAG